MSKSILFLCALCVISACSEHIDKHTSLDKSVLTEHSGDNKKRNETSDTITVRISDAQDRPLPDAYVIVYDDFGQTIEKTFLSDEQGHAVIRVSDQNSFSYSVVAVDQANDEFKGLAFYGVPVKDYEHKININNDLKLTSFCSKPISMLMNISSSIAQDWHHELYINGQLQSKFSPDSQVVLNLCESLIDDKPMNVVMISSNPQQHDQQRYYHALDVTPKDGQQFNLNYITDAVPLRFASANRLSSYTGYLAQIHRHRTLYSKWLQGDDGIAMVLPQSLSKTKLSLMVESDLKGNEHVIDYYLSERDPHTHVEPVLSQMPRLNVDSNNELSWQVEGIQPDYTTSYFEQAFESDIAMDWTVMAPGELKTIHMPALPPSLKRFEHGASRQYFDISMELHHSEEVNSLQKLMVMEESWESGDPSAKSYAVETRVAYLTE